MKRFGKIAVWLAGGLALNTGLCAPNPAATRNPPPNNPAPANPASDNPYAAIAARNIFGLVAPPPPVDPNAAAEASLPKITPEGIMGVFGNWQVLFKVAPAKPSPKDKDEYYTLSEGQRQDEIEVIKIDHESSLVTFDNHGTTQELPLAEAPASGGAPAGPFSAGGNPGVAPGATGGNNAGGFTRFGAGPGGNNGGAPNGSPGSAGGGPSSVNGGMNFGANTQARIYQPEASTMTAEEAAVLTAAQHLDAIKRNDPIAPLYPSTPVDKEAGITPNEGTGNPPPNP